MNDVSRYVARLAPLLVQLARAYRKHGEELPPALREVGSLGERHIGVLITLGMGGPLSVSELAKQREMTVAHASLVVGELDRAGLVGRDHDPQDRRRILVSLSETGRGAVAEMRSRVAGPVVGFLSELEEAEAEEFIGRLGRLLELIKDSGQAGGSGDSEAAEGAGSAASAESAGFRGARGR